MRTIERRGPGNPPSLTVGARRLSPEHVSRLRVLVARLGSVHAISPLLKTSPEAVRDVLTERVFRAKSADALERKIDALHRELEEAGAALSVESPQRGVRPGAGVS
jgi:hypothetical protein